MRLETGIWRPLLKGSELHFQFAFNAFLSIGEVWTLRNMGLGQSSANGESKHIRRPSGMCLCFACRPKDLLTNRCFSGVLHICLPIFSSLCAPSFHVSRCRTSSASTASFALFLAVYHEIPPFIMMRLFLISRLLFIQDSPPSGICGNGHSFLWRGTIRTSSFVLPLVSVIENWARRNIEIEN